MQNIATDLQIMKCPAVSRANHMAVAGSASTPLAYGDHHFITSFPIPYTSQLFHASYFAATLLRPTH